MSMLKFSDRDRKQGMVVAPGYYRVRINKVSEAISKKGNSKNYVIDDAEILADENGDTKYSGVPVGKPWWGFNSQVAHFMIPFVEAIKGEPLADDEAVNWDAMAGKELMVMIVNEVVDGRMVNKVTQMYKSINRG